MKSGARFVVAALLVCLTASRPAALAAPAKSTEAVQPAAMKVLQETARTYAALKSYSGTMELTKKATYGGRQQSQTVSVSFAVRKPNLLEARFSVGPDTISMLWDGKASWTLYSGTGKYVRGKAPADLAGLKDDRLAQALIGDMDRVSFALFGPNPQAALTRGMKAARMLEAEKVDGEPADHLALTVEEGNLELWIGAEDRLVRRARLNALQAARQIMAANPGLKDLKVTVELTLKGGASKPGADSFVFKPPAGSRQVASMQEMFSLTQTPMKEFSLPGLEKDATFRLADHKGKVIAIDFWATWCGPCRMEMPKLQQIYNDYKARGLVFVAVNLQESPDKVKAFLEELKLDVPVALDAEGKVAELYAISGLPTLVLIGRDGLISSVHEGYFPAMEQRLRKELDGLLGPAVPPKK